jgi:hypothetical protein
MARAKLNGRKQRVYLGRMLAIVGFAMAFTDLWLLVKPLLELASSIHQGAWGLLPSLGMCLLNATNAIAFHQIGYGWLISHMLVLCCAMVAVVMGTRLLRRKTARPLIFELALSPEFEGRETINNGSR